MALSVKGTYFTLEQFVRNMLLKKMGILFSVNSSNLAILIKTLTNYFQIISAIPTFRIELPDSVKSVSENLGNPVKSMAYSLDCMLL
jgi:threonine synthase